MLARIVLSTGSRMVLMERLLGILTEAPTSLDTSLRTSIAGARGWGVAVLAGERWEMQRGRGETRALDATRALAVVAHTGTSTTNATPPLRAGRWMFALTGSARDARVLRPRISEPRLRACEGESAAEIVFAFLLTALDSGKARDAALFAASSELDRAGAMAFVLTDGESLYARRAEEPLYLLERPRSAGGPATAFVASEPLTNEPWVPLAQRSLVRARRGRELVFEPLPRRETSDVELPFTD